MTDRDIVKVRLSGTNISRLADKIAELDGWTVLECSSPRRNRRRYAETLAASAVPAEQSHAATLLAVLDAGS